MHRIVISSLWIAVQIMWTLHYFTRKIAYSLEEKRLQRICSLLWIVSRTTYQAQSWLRGVAYSYERWTEKIPSVKNPDIRPHALISLNLPVWGLIRFAALAVSTVTVAWLLAWVVKLLTT